MQKNGFTIYILYVSFIKAYVKEYNCVWEY